MTFWILSHGENDHDALTIMCDKNHRSAAIMLSKRPFKQVDVNLLKGCVCHKNDPPAATDHVLCKSIVIIKIKKPQPDDCGNNKSIGFHRRKQT